MPVYDCLFSGLGRQHSLSCLTLPGVQCGNLLAWTQHCYSCLPAALEAEEAAELNDGTTITVSLEPGLDEIFEEGSRRLLEKSTWKLWQWPPEEQEFFDADSFR